MLVKVGKPATSEMDDGWDASIKDVRTVGDTSNSRDSRNVKKQRGHNTSDANNRTFQQQL